MQSFGFRKLKLSCVVECLLTGERKDNSFPITRVRHGVHIKLYSINCLSMVISSVKNMEVHTDSDSFCISIYCDTGADISKMKAFTWCKFYQFPYDSPDRPKKPLLLAQPSAAQWRDCHAAWKEFTEITWGDFAGSSLYLDVEAIIGKGPENRRDVLHFDSAYKTGCKIFLTFG